MLVQGIEFQTTEEPRFAALGDYPLAQEHPEVAVAELDRLAEVGKIPW